MKKKISIIATLLLSMFLLTGCGAAKTPEEVVKNHFKDISKSFSNDISKSILSGFVSSEDVNEELADTLIDTLAKMETKTTGEKITGDTATVSVSVKGINFQTIITSYISSCMAEADSLQSLSEEEINKFAQDMLIKELNKATLEEREGTINLTKTSDGGWKISEDDDYTKALLGVATSDLQ